MQRSYSARQVINTAIGTSHTKKVILTLLHALLKARQRIIDQLRASPAGTVAAGAPLCDRCTSCGARTRTQYLLQQVGHIDRFANRTKNVTLH